jgi:hypothetical protein
MYPQILVQNSFFFHIYKICNSVNPKVMFCTKLSSGYVQPDPFVFIIWRDFIWSSL